AGRPAAGAEKKSARAAEQDRPDVAARRAAWRAAQPGLDPAGLKFVDETWAATNMARTHGRCPVGERLVMAVPHGHWKTTTFVAALGTGGMSAPTVVDGAMTGDLFEAYGRQELAPTLAARGGGGMGNVAVHKGPGGAAGVAAGR